MCGIIYHSTTNQLKTLVEITDMQLLETLVPDMRERLTKVQSEQPDVFQEITRRVMQKETGWNPFGWMQGSM